MVSVKACSGSVALLTMDPARKYVVLSCACLSDRPASFWVFIFALGVDFDEGLTPLDCAAAEGRWVKGFEPPVQAFCVGGRL